ncbi:MAG: dTMP kinase [Candidatus Omnitrophota bacterium]
MAQEGRTRKGKFITFEGSEGCGKSTQSRMLYRYLKKKGYDVVFLREPGGVKISEKIRGILLDNRNKTMSSACETLLYMAARAEVVERLIRPSLKAGKIVVCDRFMDSTLVYQGYGLGVNMHYIKAIGEFVSAGIKPDLTILLDLAVKKGLKHRQAAKDRIEQRPLSYHLLVRRGYLSLARREPKRIKTVRVQEHKSLTQGIIRGLVDSLLSIT